MKKHLAVFASGTGTNFVAIAQACERGEIPAEVVLMVCDKPGAPVIERARELGIETFVFAPKEFAGKAAYEAEIVRLLDARQVDLVCLAGYMRIVGTPCCRPTTARSSTSTLRSCPLSGGRMRWSRPSPLA